MIDKLRTFALNNLQAVSVWAGGVLGAGMLLFWRLGSLTQGYATEETQAYHTAMQPSNFLDNPLNWPFYALTKAFSYLAAHSFVAARLSATAFALAFLVTFFVVIRHWHGQRVSVLATILLGTSAWFLHIARLGTPEVLFLLLSMLALSGFWLVHHYNLWAMLLCTLLFVLLVYVPGMIWFIVAGGVWQWKAVYRALTRHMVLTTIGTVVGLLALAPLGWAFVKDTSLIWNWLGWPQTFPSLLEIGKNLVRVPAQIFMYHRVDSLHWLGTLPMLDIFSTVMVLLGGYLYLRNWRLGRTQVLTLVVVLGWVLASLGGPVTVSVIMPVVYVLAAAGIDYLLGEWLAVFPRNPIARTLGVCMVGFVLALACVYNLRHYFVGWPQASATQSVFVEHERP